MIKIEKVEKERTITTHGCGMGHWYTHYTDIYYLVTDTKTGKKDIFHNIPERTLIAKICSSFIDSEVLKDNEIKISIYPSPNKDRLVSWTENIKEKKWFIPIIKNKRFYKRVPYDVVELEIPENFKLGIYEEYFSNNGKGKYTLKEEYVGVLRDWEINKEYLYCLNLLDWPDIEKYL